MFITLDNIKHKKICEPNTNYRDISTEGLESFREQINITDWSVVLSKVSADEAYESFLQTFCDIYNRVFKYKKHIVHKKCRKPWVTAEILKMMKKKDALYRKFMRTRDPVVLSSFKSQRNKITSELRRAKRSYYFLLFRDEKRTDVLWKKLNSILHEGRQFGETTELAVEGILKKVQLLQTRSMIFLSTKLTAFTLLNLRNMFNVFLTAYFSLQVARKKLFQFL